MAKLRPDPDDDTFPARRPLVRRRRHLGPTKTPAEDRSFPAVDPAEDDRRPQDEDREPDDDWDDPQRPELDTFWDLDPEVDQEAEPERGDFWIEPNDEDE